jgi:hypothetical protein
MNVRLFTVRCYCPNITIERSTALSRKTITVNEYILNVVIVGERFALKIVRYQP